jgi:uncharacterized membrane protein
MTDNHLGEVLKMLWMWVTVGAAVWVVAAVAVGIVLSRMVRMRDDLERPRAEMRAQQSAARQRDAAHRAS